MVLATVPVHSVLESGTHFVGRMFAQTSLRDWPSHDMTLPPYVVYEYV